MGWGSISDFVSAPVQAVQSVVQAVSQPVQTVQSVVSSAQSAVSNVGNAVKTTYDTGASIAELAKLIATDKTVRDYVIGSSLESIRGGLSDIPVVGRVTDSLLNPLINKYALPQFDQYYQDLYYDPYGQQTQQSAPLDPLVALFSSILGGMNGVYNPYGSQIRNPYQGMNNNPYGQGSMGGYGNPYQSAGNPYETAKNSYNVVIDEVTKLKRLFFG